MNFFKILHDNIGTLGMRLKYGVESGGVCRIGMGASEVIKAASGRFVTLNTAGNAHLTSAADTTLFGAVEGGYDVTCSAVAGGTQLMCRVDTQELYRIPINSGTYSHATYRGVKCDLSIVAGIQGAALATTSGGHVLIVDGDVANNKWVIVKMNGAIQGKTAA